VTHLQIVAATVAVALGAAVQGSVGFGLSLVAVPLLALIEPRLLPGPLLCVAIVLTLLLANRERRSIDFHGVTWGIAGRVPGAVLGATALKVVPQERISLMIGILVILAVGISLLPVRIRPTAPRLLGAGILSGFMGTTAAVGGPPIALLLQHSPGPQLRGTLSGFFVLGASVSLLALIVIGRFGLPELWLAFLLLPGIIIGFWASARTVRIMDRGHTRTSVLVLSGAAAVAVILRQVL
jgi:uncharacterized membrane protein YfcA